MVEVAAAEVLGDGQAAQAVAGVVEIPGPWGDIGVLRGGLEHHSAPPGWYSLARLVEQPPGWALAAQQDVFLQRRLVQHPVGHAERRVAWSGGDSEMPGGGLGRWKPPPRGLPTPPRDPPRCPVKPQCQNPPENSDMRSHSHFALCWLPKPPSPLPGDAVFGGAEAGGTPAA